VEVVNIRVEDVVPHRGTSLLIDRLLAYDEGFMAVEALVRGDNVFAAAQGVPVWVGIEYMAQAIAAWAGCRALRTNTPVRLGFLLGTRRFDCVEEYFRLGQRLRIEARRELSAENGMGMFACRILIATVEVAKANVLVYEPPDIEDFLNGAAE